MNGAREFDRLSTMMPDQRRGAPRTGPAAGPGSPPVEHDGNCLLTLIGLDRAQAPEPVVAEAVKRALDNGWSWTPIAIVLRSSRAATIARFGRAIGHPVLRRRSATRSRSGAQGRHEAEPVTPEQ